MAFILWRKRKNGRKYATVVWHPDPSKPRLEKYEATGLANTSQAEIQLRYWQRREDTAKGSGHSGPAVEVGNDPMKALELFLAEKAVGVGSPESLKTYRQKLTPFFTWMNGRPLRTWRRSDVVRYMAERDWAPATKHMLRSRLRQFTRWAEASDVLCPDFTAGLQVPRIVVHEVDVLTGEQLAAVFKEAEKGGRKSDQGPHYLQVPIALASFAGMDSADFYSLDWSEVDLEARLIRRKRSKTSVVVEIPIRDRLAQLLMELSHRKGLVCRGLPADPRCALRAFPRLCKRAGVPEAPPKQNGFRRLRHTQATIMAAAGVDISTVGQSLGHRKGSTMALRYVERDRERHAAAIDAVEASMSAASTSRKN